jgi:uncharacterized protein
MNAARASLLALLLCWAFAAAADVAVPQLSGRVVDQTGTLSSGDVDALTQKLRDFETRKGSQIAVLIVPTTAPESIEQYSIRVAEAWKIGRKKIDDGAILLVAKDDHKLRIEVGYGLEGALTDVTAQRIIDQIITPKFRSGDFAGGISDGVDRIMSVVDGEPLPVPAPRQQSGSGSSDFTSFLNPFNPFTIIIVLVLGGAFRKIFGRLFGSVATGGLIGVVAWFIFGSMIVSGIAGIIASVVTMFSDSITAPAARGRGGWSGGSSSGGGWSGGSSSSDSGGFSGGGGSFGGGGASGSW